MTDIAPIGRPNPAGFSSGVRPLSADQSSPSTTRSSDRVELSEASRMLSQLNQLPEVRTDLVNQMRQQIASGNYDTPDKIDALLDELAFDLQ